MSMLRTKPFYRKVLFLSVLALSLFNSKVISQTPVETHGALSVDKTKIVDKNGDVVSFAGNSLFWSNTGWGGEDYYTSAVVSWLYEDWNSSIIRAAMGVDESGGYISDTTNEAKVDTVVQAAIKTGIYVIIDWHSHYAQDYEDEAIAFFKKMANKYGSYDNVIYEIYNEPLNTTSWSSVIKPYAENVIAAIRAIDDDNLIIVGTSSWSQDVDVASGDPIEDYSNIAYCLHFYAGSHGESLRTKAKTALDNGIALFVTEWGSVNADGDGDVAESSVLDWMDFLCENDISHCNWAINDKSEGASSLVSDASVDGNWTDDDLTTSGKLVKSIINKWDSYCDDETTGLNEAIEGKSVNLYPNPASDIVYLELPLDEEVLSVDLLNMDGLCIKHKTKSCNQLDVSCCNSGTYLVSIETDRGMVTTKLLIK